MTAMQARTVRVLVVGQVLQGLGQGATLALGSVIAAEMAGDPFAGAAATASTLGAAAASIPLARIAQRRGRRPALAGGAATAGLGAVLVVAAVAVNVFPLLIVGYMMLGTGTAVGLQARFTATDMASAAHRGRDLSIVVWSTTIGAVAGPNLFGPGVVIAQALGLPELTGSFAIAIAAQLSATVIYLVALRPDPLLVARDSALAAPPVVESGAISRRSTLIFAIVTIAVSHAVMVSVMSMTPVHLTHHDASLSIIGFTISLHVAGMFALSPLFGWASDRLGRIPVILIGQLLYVVAVFVLGLGAENTVFVTVGLVLLGLGWSASTVSGSALVSDVATGSARVRIQGRTDTLMSLTGAAGGALAGPVLALVGYAGLAWGVGILVLGLIAAAATMQGRSRLVVS